MDKEKRKAYAAEYYKNNRDKLLAKSIEWQKNNRERTREINRKALKKHYIKHKEKIQERIGRVRMEQPEKYREIQRKACKKYQQKNADILAMKRRDKYPSIKKPSVEKRREYFKNMNKNNLNHNIKARLRSALNNAFKKSGVGRKYRTIELLGISIEEFKKYLEERFKPGMSWENKGEWHIDHIKPCATFDLTSDDQQKQCFHYSNLQPLWATENKEKSSLYNGKRYNYKRNKVQ